MVQQCASAVGKVVCRRTRLQDCVLEREKDARTRWAQMMSFKKMKSPHDSNFPGSRERMKEVHLQKWVTVAGEKKAARQTTATAGGQHRMDFWPVSTHSASPWKELFLQCLQSINWLGPGQVAGGTLWAVGVPVEQHAASSAGSRVAASTSPCTLLRDFPSEQSAVCVLLWARTRRQ